MHANREDEPIPSGQILYDRMFLWLVLGLIIPTVIFTVWGLIDIFVLTPPAVIVQ